MKNRTEKSEERGKILVIEDDPDLREVMSIWLGDEAFTVVAVSNALAGLEQLTTADPPCLVLLDWRMPGMNGEAFLTRMRADEKLATVPVVVLSGAHDVKAPPDVKIIQKPFDLDALRRAVLEVCSTVSSA